MIRGLIFDMDGTCLVFEDALSGIEAGRRAGMPVIALTTSHTPDEVAHLPSVWQAVSDFTQVRLQDLLMA